MAWLIFASSIAMASILLIPLAKKCEIRAKYALIMSSIAGIVAGFFVNTVNLLTERANALFLAGLEFGAILIVTFLFTVYRFYRDPVRIPPKRDNIILSPADGTIKYVKRIEKSEVPLSSKGKSKFSLQELTRTDLTANEAWLIGITMTYIDIHINRSPIKGRVTLVKHIGGKFVSLKRNYAPILNERATMVIDNGLFKVGVVLIASRLVRRIISYVKEGHSLEIGEKIGKITFGSQADIVLPALPGLKIDVKQGEQVFAGSSVIARYD